MPSSEGLEKTGCVSFSTTTKRSRKKHHRSPRMPPHKTHHVPRDKDDLVRGAAVLGLVLEVEDAEPGLALGQRAKELVKVLFLFKQRGGVDKRGSMRWKKCVGILWEAPARHSRGRGIHKQKNKQPEERRPHVWTVYAPRKRSSPPGPPRCPQS